MNKKAACTILEKMGACWESLLWLNKFDDDTPVSDIINELTPWNGVPWLFWIVEHDAWSADACSVARFVFNSSTKDAWNTFLSKSAQIFENTGVGITVAYWADTSSFMYNVYAEIVEEYEQQVYSQWIAYRDAVSPIAYKYLELFNQ